MSAHTPGPWEVRFFRSKSHRIDAPGWDELAVVYGNEDDDLDRQGRANARLIAAAPDLLAACRLLLDSERSLGDLCAGGCRPGINQHTQGCAVAVASAAIAKAEGKS